MLLHTLAWVVIAGLALEAIGLLAHARDMQQRGGEGAAAQMLQTTKFAYSYLMRNILLALTLLGMLGFVVLAPAGIMATSLWALMALATVIFAVVGRMLFYALVIPTTMPGAFFWRNPAFQQHARETGLAKMPQVGVVMDAH
jgi:Na+/serine symporter